MEKREKVPSDESLPKMPTMECWAFHWLTRVQVPRAVGMDPLPVSPRVNMSRKLELEGEPTDGGTATLSTIPDTGPNTQLTYTFKYN